MLCFIQTESTSIHHVSGGGMVQVLEHCRFCTVK